MHPLKRTSQTRDDLFIKRYAQLRDLALKLTNHNLQEAEDLLHDSFIYFTLCQTPVEQIENLDGYLYTMLRNLRLSRIRRLARLPQGQLSLIDYDSAELALSSVDPRDQIRIQDELRAICRYSIVRKASAKVGSVLILRFFHGYLPTEIASLLKVKRSAVDNLLQTARREARLYNSDPNSITFLAADKSIRIPEFHFGQLSSDILTEVRQAIFEEPTTNCPIAHLREIYAKPATVAPESNDGPVNSGLLAHIVACQSCLDEATEILGIPNLSTRISSDTEGSDKKPRSGGGGGSTGGGGGISSADRFFRNSRKRLKQIFEHHPRELMISVNGFIIGSQRINSERSELALSVNLDEKIGFIEVFSERDVCLLFQSVEPPPEGPAVQPARVELSGERVLEISLDFSGAWPQLNATYLDPSFHEVRSSSEIGEVTNDRELISEPRDSSKASGGIVSSMIEKLRRSNVKLWLQPARLTVAFTVVIVAAFAIWQFKGDTSQETLSAATLLARAASAEQQLAASPNVVIHRTIDLEERNEQGAVLASRKIEGWSSGEQRLSVRRLYNEQGKLIAGEWERADGSRTLYSAFQKAKSLQETTSTPVSIDDAWLTDPSAAAFQRLSEPNARVDIQESLDTYTVSYLPASDSVSGTSARIVEASIVFRKDDLRAIEQSLTVQSGEQRRAYHYAEANYIRLSPQSVSPSVFEPEKELLGTPLILLKQTEVHDTAANISAAPSGVGTAASTSVAATADLEVEALNLLNQVGADTGEQINATRDKQGLLRIDGLVNTETRKNELLRALSPIATSPAVRINILTIAEAEAKEKRSKRSQNGKTGNVSVEMFNTAGESPAQAKLRSFFGSDDAANAFAIKMISRSRAAMSHAAALKRLVDQFSSADISTLSPDAREKWLALIRLHARAFQQEAAGLRQELSPVFDGGGSSGGNAPPITDESALVRAVERLFDLGSANDRAVRAALSISNDRAAGLSQEFFRNVRTTEEIALGIQAIK